MDEEENESDDGSDQTATIENGNEAYYDIGATRQ